MGTPRFISLVLLLCVGFVADAQRPIAETYSRLNTFSSFAEYSNGSGHIILGAARGRKIGAIGFQYQRRLIHRPLLDFSYTAELRPGMLESDPLATQTLVIYGQSPTPPITKSVIYCVTGTVPYSFTVFGSSPPYTVTEYITTTCNSRRTVTEQGFSPGGIRLNLLPRHRLQPTFSSFAGYMFSTQEVPVPGAGSFNFTFDFGGGLEFYRSHERSIRLEYQVQHFSNKETAYYNPGVDSGFLKLTYAFGR